MVKAKDLRPATCDLRPQYAEVVLGIPVDKSFTYSIPAELKETIQVGQRVEVPFGQRKKIGYVVALTAQTAFNNIRPISHLLGEAPFVDQKMLELTRQVADYYCASWGEVIEAAHPANVRKRKKAIPESALLPEMIRNAEALAPNNHTLSAQQKQAIKAITKSIDENKHQVFLLHGITASGKTEVYLQTIAAVLAKGKSSIMLVPEIALTPQTVERFKSRFGEKIALMHSQLSTGERAREWQRIKNGLAQIVIGARSAVFAPLSNLGLIVVDEEHENTYKQQENAPRYHARDVAIMRAKMENASVILGSATPSLESYYNAKQGKIKLLSLPERVTKQDLPQVTIVDMRQEIAQRRRRLNILSRVLEMKIRQTLEKKEQVILFLNRRGFSTYVSCPQCGYVAKCKRCNVTLTYHYATKSLVCHYCNYQSEPPALCPQCGRGYLRYFGLGTEKVESELYRLFPEARIARMDTDVTRERNAHARILGAFKKGEIDILIGTQMVAKGLDFPRVGLVGVVSADTALNLPDFRSGERTFNLLTQVAGRTGRGESEGEVLIQTYVPENYAIDSSINHDYRQFYRREIKSRGELSLPPFTHLTNITLRGKSEQKVRQGAADLAQTLKKKAGVDIAILGPAPAPVSKIRGNFLWQVLIKGKNPAALGVLLRKILPDCRHYKGLALAVDVDPL
ncbi:MAG: primosomal protein N' [Candidatus Omnitrophota bacterium]